MTVIVRSEGVNLTITVAQGFRNDNATFVPSDLLG